MSRAARRAVRAEREARAVETVLTLVPRLAPYEIGRGLAARLLRGTGTRLSWAERRRVLARFGRSANRRVGDLVALALGLLAVAGMVALGVWVWPW